MGQKSMACSLEGEGGRAQPWPVARPYVTNVMSGQMMTEHLAFLWVGEALVDSRSCLFSD